MHERLNRSIPTSRNKPLHTSGLVDLGLVLPKTFPDLLNPKHRYVKFVKQLQAENPDANLSWEVVDIAARFINQRQTGTDSDAIFRAANLIKQVCYSTSDSTSLDWRGLMRLARS